MIKYFKTYLSEKKYLTQCLEELINEVISVKRQYKITDRDLNQKGFYIADLKTKIDNSLADQSKLFDDMR